MLPQPACTATHTQNVHMMFCQQQHVQTVVWAVTCQQARTQQNAAATSWQSNTRKTCQCCSACMYRSEALARLQMRHCAETSRVL
jgi:hypothetical protein